MPSLYPIFSAVLQVINFSASWVSKFIKLLIGPYWVDGALQENYITPLGLFVIVLPLVGLGIGIIKRILKTR